MEYPKRFYIYYAIITLRLYLSLKTLRWVLKINLISSQFTHICLLHIYTHTHTQYVVLLSNSLNLKLKFVMKKKKFLRPR